jgi:putative addiction module killer protein
MYTIIQLAEFEAWLAALTDKQAKSRISVRLRNAGLGNFGDCASVGEGVSEMRVHVGAGYRVYYTRTGLTVYVIMTGGDKSTQAKDIARAKQIARKLKEEKQ